MTDCYHCGSEEHLSYDCDQRTRGHPSARRRLWAKAQPPEASEQPSEQDRLPAYQHMDLTRRDPAETQRIYREWGPVTREVLAIVLGQHIRPGQEDPCVYTEFRRQFGLPRRTEEECRAIARAQVAELHQV